MEQNLAIKNKDCGSIEKSVQSEAKPSKIYRIVYVIWFQLYLKKENVGKKTGSKYSVNSSIWLVRIWVNFSTFLCSKFYLINILYFK